MTGVDIIGSIYNDPAEPMGEAVRVWGWHVNITLEVLAAYPELEARIVSPATLRQVWAGDDPSSPTRTIALRFNGENAARSALGDLWPADLA